MQCMTIWWYPYLYFIICEDYVYISQVWFQYLHEEISPHKGESCYYIFIYIYLTNYIFRLCLLLCHRAANKLQYLVILNQLQIYHKIITITRRDEGPCRATTLWWIISLERIMKMIQILEILILLVNNGFNIRNAKKHKLRGEIIF